MTNSVLTMSSKVNLESLQSRLCRSEHGQKVIQQLRQVEALVESHLQPAPAAKPLPRAQVTFPYRSNPK